MHEAVVNDVVSPCSWPKLSSNKNRCFFTTISEELKELWDSGIHTYDVSTKKNVSIA